MRRSLLSTFLTIALPVVAMASDGAHDTRAAHDQQSFGQIERGRYLAMLGDCAACHTEPGGKPYAGGRAIQTPFGGLLAPNLTPDVETGIGGWSDDEFVASLLQGRGRGGAHLYPAMPYTYYTKMTREDALAIRAYLGTIEAVRNEVTANQLPFPFNIRATMVFWNTLYFKPGTFRPVAGKSDDWNRGAYLVEGPGHCGMCHTAKSSLGGDKTDQALQGGVLQGWFSPDLTAAPRTGLGAWSIDDIVAYLRVGHNRVSAASGPMAEVIDDSTSHLTEEDLKAIATYLKDQTAPAGKQEPQAIAADDPAMKSGKAIYVDNCSACHAPDGTGIANLFPPLKASPIVQSASPATLIEVVLHGTRNVATPSAPTGAGMPAMAWKLSDQQVAAVLTYIRNSWGNASPRVSADDVHGGHGQ